MIDATVTGIVESIDPSDMTCYVTVTQVHYSTDTATSVHMEIDEIVGFSKCLFSSERKPQVGDAVKVSRDVGTTQYWFATVTGKTQPKLDWTKLGF